MGPASAGRIPGADGPSPAFVVDHMLIRVGRWLRLCGYDTTWDPTLDTRALIRRANAECRVFVTCNSHIPHNFPAPLAWVRIRSASPIEQFHEIVARLGLDPARHAFSRCVNCNRPLEAISPSDEVTASLPPRIRERQPSLWRCPECRRLYWHGSHVERTRRMLALPLL